MSWSDLTWSAGGKSHCPETFWDALTATSFARVADIALILNIASTVSHQLGYLIPPVVPVSIRREHLPSCLQVAADTICLQLNGVIIDAEPRGHEPRNGKALRACGLCVSTRARVSSSFAITVRR